VDTDLYRWFNRLADRTSWAQGFFRFYANAGIVILGALLLACYIDAWYHGTTRQAAASIWTGAATLIALGIGQVIGNAVDKARPYAVMTDVHVLVDRTTDFSTPSDHATVAGAIAVGLLLANRKWGWAALGAGLLMMFTRVYVGAHYPSDVLAGAVLGGTVAALGHFLLVPHLAKLVTRLERTPLRVLFARSTVPIQ
jgi:membrane-associated phospholipid phosphatase